MIKININVSTGLYKLNMAGILMKWFDYFLILILILISIVISIIVSVLVYKTNIFFSWFYVKLVIMRGLYSEFTILHLRCYWIYWKCKNVCQEIYFHSKKLVCTKVIYQLFTQLWKIYGIRILKQYALWLIWMYYECIIMSIHWYKLFSGYYYTIYKYQQNIFYWYNLLVICNMQKYWLNYKSTVYKYVYWLYNKKVLVVKWYYERTVLQLNLVCLL